jgi:hypothetical protein
MKKLIIASSVFLAPSISAVQELSVISFPEVGVESTISVGEEIYSYVKVYTMDGARLDADTKAGSWLLEEIVPKGTELVPVNTKVKFKACVHWTTSFDVRGPCFLDYDGDGTFDRHAGTDTEMARKLKVPVPYTKQKITSVRADSFKQVILYQGATTDSIRFSYREFKDDMARPAFTEEMSIPRETFPSMVRIKKPSAGNFCSDGNGLALSNSEGQVIQIQVRPQLDSVIPTDPETPPTQTHARI